MGKAEVQLCEMTRHLGVTVTKSLTWSAHIDNILNRVTLELQDICPEALGLEVSQQHQGERERRERERERERERDRERERGRERRKIWTELLPKTIGNRKRDCA